MDVNLEDGIIKDEETHSRIIFLGIGGWEAIREELDSTFLTGSDVILQRMGYGYGGSLGRIIKQRREVQKLDPYQAIRTMIIRSGWGRSGLKSGDIIKGGARIAIKDCFFCAASPRKELPDCFFLAGSLAGMIDEITGTPHRVVEDKCNAKGDAFCEFVVELLVDERLSTTVNR